MFPRLKRVGVAWNPAEANSRAFVENAREVCRDRGIELLEANVENSNSVLEAEDSLVSRGAQALWIGGDVTVSVAADSVILVGRRAHIPVFSITPGKPDRGTLFDYGADFYQIGKKMGELASRILHGADPTQIPVTNEVPIHLSKNIQRLAQCQARPERHSLATGVIRQIPAFLPEYALLRGCNGQPALPLSSSKTSPKEKSVLKKWLWKAFFVALAAFAELFLISSPESMKS